MWFEFCKKSLCLKQQAISLLLENGEIIYFDQFFKELFLSEVNPDIPPQVADLISRCQVTIVVYKNVVVIICGLLAS